MAGMAFILFSLAAIGMGLFILSQSELSLGITAGLIMTLWGAAGLIWGVLLIRNGTAR